MPETGTQGRKWKLYYNSATYALPTWVEVPEAQDISFPFQTDQLEWLDRATEFKQYVDGFTDIGFEFGLTYAAGNANHAALQAAAIARTEMDVCLMDQPVATSGADGFRMFALVSGFDTSLPIADKTEVSVVLKPTPKQESSAYVYPVKFTTA